MAEEGKEGVEVIDGSSSTSDTATTHRMDKNIHRRIVHATSFKESSAMRNTLPLYTDPREDEDSLTPPAPNVGRLEDEEDDHNNIPTQLGMEVVVGIVGDETDTLPSDMALCDDDEEDDLSEGVPIRHIIPRNNHHYDDDVSSYHYANMEVAPYGDHHHHHDRDCDVQYYNNTVVPIQPQSSSRRNQHIHRSNTNNSGNNNSKSSNIVHLNNKRSYVVHREKMNNKNYEKKINSKKDHSNSHHSNEASSLNRSKNMDKKKSMHHNATRYHEQQPHVRHNNEPSSFLQRSKNLMNKKSLHHVPSHEQQPPMERFVIGGMSIEQSEDEEDAEQRKKKCRNATAVIVLLCFMGLVVLIAVGVGVQIKKNSNSNPDDPRMGASASVANTVNGNDGSSGGNDDVVFDSNNNSFAMTATSAPTSFPTRGGPCIALEVGIIFDEYSGETGWMLVAGNYYPENPEKNDIVWESRYYDPSEYSKRADTAHKCFSQGYYTFVFTDGNGDGICCNHGKGSYVLSSQGKVITIGGEMRSKEETFVFGLPYVEPKPVDTNGNGRDDRLESMMPYDSSNMIEGVDCENFRLVILTDEYGLETTWELFEGRDKASGTLIANGGPYGSRYTYVVNYCLASPKEYALYVYDWDRRGLCCESGRGWYRVFSGDVVIVDSDGQFGEADFTQFTLPVGV